MFSTLECFWLHRVCRLYDMLEKQWTWSDCLRIISGFVSYRVRHV